jgi:hypothetical protein
MAILSTVCHSHCCDRASDGGVDSTKAILNGAQAK